MNNRIISVSSAPYDGYDFPVVLESLARCGVSHVEPAFIVGYTEPFGEEDFLPEKAIQYLNCLKASGLACYAFSSHIDLGRDDAVDVFTRRMEFAAYLGAKVINTNAAARSNETKFFKNIERLIPLAEQLDLMIGLENPGDGSDNLINVAQDGKVLIDKLNSPYVRLNYDAANTASHRPEGGRAGVNPCQDALDAMPWCGHVHIKDLNITSSGYYFMQIGEGEIGCESILEAIIPTLLNVSIEIPLRLHRDKNAQPVRREKPVPIAEIEAVVSKSVQFVESVLHCSSDARQSS